MQRKTTLRLSAVVLGAALLAAACGSDKKDSSGATTTAAAGGATTSAAAGGGVKCDAVAIGFIGALTGPNANLGINIKNGAQLALDQFAAKNPDCKVTLTDYDSQGSKDQSPALAKKAIDDKSVVGILGPAFSGESRAANPLLNEAGLPLITPSATAVDLGTTGWKVFHRALTTDGPQGEAAARYIKDTLAAKKVFVIDDQTDYGKGLADQVKTTLGDLVSGTDKTQEKQTDFSAVVSAVKSAAPDAIFYGGYYAEAGPFVKQLRDAGVTAKFVTGDGVKDPGFVEGAGNAAAEGVIITCPCAPPETFKEFFDAYKAKFSSDPGTYGAEAYDSINAFLAAITAGKVSRADIQTFLSTYDAPGITKQMKWDDKGEVLDKSVFAYEVKNGVITGLGVIK